MVAQSTFVTVIALSIVGHMCASDLGSTSIVGAQVGIVAQESPCTLAIAKRAGVSCSAEVTVITRRVVEQVDAAVGRMTCVGGTDILVIARKQASRSARSILAMVTDRASVAIIALPNGEALIGAAESDQALVQSARVPVITIELFPGYTAGLGMATLGTIARIKIVTNQGLASDTSEFGSASLLAIANVPIVAVERVPRLAAKNRVTTLHAVALVIVVAN